MCTSAIGDLYNAEVSEKTGEYNRDVYNYQAYLDDRRAVNAEETGERDAEQLTLDREQTVSSGMAKFASNGLLIDLSDASNAAAVWQRDQYDDLKADRQRILDDAATTAWSYRANASLERDQAEMAEQTGENQSTAYQISAVTDIAKTGIQFATA